jgi:NAD dependent epimerase/dehydratase family enzyme
MSANRGGIFDVLLGLVRAGLGGTAGDGRQMVSWIHERDFVRVIHWLIAREDTSGVVNVTSPIAVTNAEFMRALRKAWGAPIGLPAPAWLLAIGARFLGTEPELVLKSRWSAPARLLQSGFKFEWTRWEAAAVDLCSRWRRPTASPEA